MPHNEQLLAKDVFGGAVVFNSRDVSVPRQGARLGPPQELSRQDVEDDLAVAAASAQDLNVLWEVVVGDLLGSFDTSELVVEPVPRPIDTVRAVGGVGTAGAQAA